MTIHQERYQLMLTLRHALGHSLDPGMPAGIKHHEQNVRTFADQLERFIDAKIHEAFRAKPGSRKRM